MSTHLYRSRDDRMLAGVAGGLAELWDADPSLVRIIWAVLVPLTGGIALLVYIVMAIVVPEEDSGRSWGSEMVGWSGWSGTPPAGSGAAAPAATSAPGATAPEPAATGPDTTAGAQPSAPPAPGVAPQPSAWPVSRFEAREMRRAARHEARAARRAGRGYDGRSGALIVGILFILVGVWYLVREYLPTIDWDWFWPLVLVGVGVLVLFLAVRSRDDDGPGAS